MPRINEEHIAHWRKHGYVVVDEFLTGPEIAAGLQNIHRYAPTWEQYASDPSKVPGGMSWHEFPFTGDALNNNATHPEIVSFLERALGTRELFMTQSLLWAKYAGAPGAEQEFHVDYDDNSLLVPHPAYPQVPMILYYTQVSLKDGPTWVVPSEHTAGRPPWPNKRSRETDPQLYEHAEPAVVKAGGLLIFNMTTYHRGSAFTASSGCRFAQHLVYRTAGAEWQSWRALAPSASKPEMVRFMQQATPRQRELIGVPGPGHPYWTPETIAGVQARYPGMDMSPYGP